MSIQQKIRNIDAEQIMLVVLVGLGVVFYVTPITEDYPDSASVFPQGTAAVVIVGSLLLLGRNYLPNILKTFVAESVNITDTSGTVDDFMGQTAEDEESATETDVKDAGPRTLGEEYGITVNDTVFMMVSSVIYLIIGWAVGLLYVTPLFVFAYTQWFRVRWYIGLGLAIAATLIIYGFIVFLLLPFDSGEIFLTRGLM
ncbi:hypothetical protein [Halegenticoccus tardaugens]|uniref:hypothetical protein n=1 Tax=Halegenticoccus tardaugens TaxID=2071624 RepID=UPI001E42F164|nr:hypothetical protein [Halegenticoccus tardaugens]